MVLRLAVEAAAWGDHLRAILRDVPGLVPVSKGNGYGFGLQRCAREARRLQTDSMAVGIPREVAEARAGGFNRDIVVLNPWRPGDSTANSLLEDPQVITTVSRREDLEMIQKKYPGARVLLELQTAMRRHGMRAEELTDLDLSDVKFEGWSIHLPSKGTLAEATELARVGLAFYDAPVWVSHLDIGDYRSFWESLGQRARMRVGTRLWLGAKQAMRARATVLDIHRVKGGDRVGYHQVRISRDGWIIVVSGGTANGVALEAPRVQRSFKERGITAAQGMLSASGRVRSPFTIGGRKRAFVEPPHMHSSMIFVPGEYPGVAIGDEVPVAVRMTTTEFDEAVFN